MNNDQKIWLNENLDKIVNISCIIGMIICGTLLIYYN